MEFLCTSPIFYSVVLRCLQLPLRTVIGDIVAVARAHPSPHQGLALQASFSVKLGLFLRLFKSFIYFFKELSFHFFFYNNFAQKRSTRTSSVICGAQCENGNSGPLIQKLRISKLNQAWSLLNSGPHVTSRIAGYKIKELFTPASAVTCGLWQGLPEEGDRQCDMNGSRLWNRETCIQALSLVFYLGP